MSGVWQLRENYFASIKVIIFFVINILVLTSFEKNSFTSLSWPFSSFFLSSCIPRVFFCSISSTLLETFTCPYKIKILFILIDFFSILKILVPPWQNYDSSKERKFFLTIRLGYKLGDRALRLGRLGGRALRLGSLRG